MGVCCVRIYAKTLQLALVRVERVRIYGSQELQWAQARRFGSSVDCQSRYPIILLGLSCYLQYARHRNLP